MNEKRRALNPWGILVGVVAIGLVLVAAADLVRAWVNDGLREERREKVVDAMMPSLEDYRHEQDELLHRWRMIDAASGRVQIPVERAMELVVGEAGDE